MIIDLTEGDLKYLLSLVRVDRKKIQKRAERSTFVPEPGKHDANQYKLEKNFELDEQIRHALEGH